MFNPFYFIMLLYLRMFFHLKGEKLSVLLCPISYTNMVHRLLHRFLSDLIISVCFSKACSAPRAWIILQSITQPLIDPGRYHNNFQYSCHCGSCDNTATVHHRWPHVRETLNWHFTLCSWRREHIWQFGGSLGEEEAYRVGECWHDDHKGKVNMQVSR